MAKGDVSREDYDDWIEPNEALKCVVHAYGRKVNPNRWIMDRLRSNRIRAMAESCYNSITDETQERVWVRKETWDHIDGKVDDQFWSAGDLTLYGEFNGVGFDIILRFMDIRFDPAPFDKLLELSAPAPAQTTARGSPAAPQGGRPRNEWWEDMLIAIFDQLWHGQLRPERQADIEAAMNAWIELKPGRNASERSVRGRAQKVWRAWSKEGKN